MAKKNATKLEKFHLNRIAEKGCLICQRPALIHHLLRKRPRSHRWTIPLCPEHHDAPYKGSLHNDGNERRWFKQHGIDEQEWAQNEWELSLRLYGER